MLGCLHVGVGVVGHHLLIYEFILSTGHATCHFWDVSSMLFHVIIILQHVLWSYVPNVVHRLLHLIAGVCVGSRWHGAAWSMVA